MRITAIESFVCDGGLRGFGFLKVGCARQRPVNGAIASAARSRSASVL